jgi:hypothetical protein
LKQTAHNPNAFASTFLFFATQNFTAEKNKKELAIQRTGHREQCKLDTADLQMKRRTNAQHQLPASPAAVVFGGYLSALAAFRLDRQSPAIRPCV